MGKDAGSPPAAPDPAKVIGLQSQANQQAFDQQTNAARFNTSGPDSSQIWSKTPTFDNNAYTTALQGWQARNQQGSWVPPTDATSSWGGSEGGTQINTPAVPGHWAGGSGDGSPMPTKDQFTSDSWSLANQLTPQQQQIHDLTQGANTSQAALLQAITQKLQGNSSLGSAVDMSGMPALHSGEGLNPQQFDQNASDAAYRSSTRYLDPQIQQQQQALESRLGEQGFVPGTPGYDQAMGNFQRTNAQTYADARDRAVGIGNTSGSQQFQNAMSGQAFGNSARGQALQEYLTGRQEPLQEAAAIRAGLPGGGSTSTATNVPQGSAATMANTNVMDPFNTQYQGALGGYNASVQSNNANTSAGAGIISAIAIAI